MAKYSGADWIESSLKYWHPDMQVSPLGRNVADLLGELFYGIYHLDGGALSRVVWNDTHHIQVSIGWNIWATVDSDNLTRLVFLAHHMALRVDLEPSRNQYVRLLFYRRVRSGRYYQRHPSLDDAVAAFKENVSIPEYQDVEAPAEQVMA